VPLRPQISERLYQQAHVTQLRLVVELEQLELTGEEDETVRFLRRFREEIEEPQLRRTAFQ